MIKSGWKTTEFWVTVSFDAALAITNLTSINILPPKYAVLAAGVANGLYAISRGIAKYGPTVKTLVSTSAPAVVAADVPVVPAAVVVAVPAEAAPVEVPPAPDVQPPAVDPGQGKVL